MQMNAKDEKEGLFQLHRCFDPEHPFPLQSTKQLYSPGAILDPVPTTVSPDNKRSLDPFSSATLPPLCSTFAEALKKNECCTYPTSSECTSMAFSPTGRLLVAGFTDGTLQLFPTNNNLLAIQSNRFPSSPPLAAAVFGSGSSHRRIPSSHVAAQIVSKGGVHTNLLMTVDVAPDGLWAFAGVLRGSMELVAVHLGHLEQALDTQSASSSDWMDSLTVYKKVDAKLRGFGACTRVHDRYLLLTGKAIKNIHIWSFQPPMKHGDKPIWLQLYDTQTNGNTIRWLSFHICPATGALSALSKSDGQKLRVWDLSSEQQTTVSSDLQRPARPPFVDVANTEGMLGVAGGYILCGGASESMYHQVSIVNLDSGDLQSQYNHTELALPTTLSSLCGRSVDVARASIADVPPNRSRRQKRGDLKSVEGVAGMNTDSGQAILEVSDGNLVQFQSSGHGLPQLILLDGKTLPAGWSRKVCVGRVASCGLAICATALYNPSNGKGMIRLWALEGVTQRLQSPFSGFWGFRGEPTLPEPQHMSLGDDASIFAQVKLAPSSELSVQKCPPDKCVTLLALGSVQKNPSPLDPKLMVTPRLEKTVPAGSGPPLDSSLTRPPRISLEAADFHKLEGFTLSALSNAHTSSPCLLLQATTTEATIKEYAKLDGSERKPKEKPNDVVGSNHQLQKQSQLEVAKKIRRSSSLGDLGVIARKSRKTSATSSPLINRCTTEKPQVNSVLRTALPPAAKAVLKPSPPIPRKRSSVTAIRRNSDISPRPATKESVLSSSSLFKESVVQQTIFISAAEESSDVGRNYRKSFTRRQVHLGTDGGRIDVSTTMPLSKATTTTKSNTSPVTFATATHTSHPAAVVPGYDVSAESTVAVFKSPARRENKRRNTNNTDPHNATLRDLLVAECQLQERKLQRLIESYDTTTARLSSLSVNPNRSLHMLERHERERLKLAAEHQVVRYRTAKTILRGAIHMLQSIVRSPSVTSLVEAKDFWAKTLRSYQALVEERMLYQDMEGNALAARQAWECRQYQGQNLKQSVTSSTTTRMNASTASFVEEWDLLNVLSQAAECLPQGIV